MWWIRKTPTKNLAFFYRNPKQALSYRDKYGGAVAQYLKVNHKALPEGKLYAHLHNSSPIKNNFSENFIVYFWSANEEWVEYARYAKQTEANSMAKKLIDYYEEVVIVYDTPYRDESEEGAEPSF